MVCLDTSLIIDILRGNEKVKLIKDKLDSNNEQITIASPTIMELRKGLKIGKPKEGEENKINELIDSFTILNLDKHSAVLSGDIEGDLVNRGEVIDLEDIMIAGIAISNNETLITRNVKHFKKIKGLDIESY